METEIKNSEGAKTAILAVSFGTSYNDSREVTIGAIEHAIADAFPAYEVRRAFTSQVIINKLKKRDGMKIDNMKEALMKARADGIERLIVQPTHLMNGLEYRALVEDLRNYGNMFETVVLGEPLLTAQEDFMAVMEAVTADTAAYDDGSTAICFMGHGTEAESNAVYERLQGILREAGYRNYFIGTVEARPTLDDLVTTVKKSGIYKKAVLKPLMVVAGDHANNDMAKDEDGSWKRTFEEAGYEVRCIMEGLGQMEAIRKIYVNHVKDSLNRLSELYSGQKNKC